MINYSTEGDVPLLLLDPHSSDQPSQMKEWSERSPGPDIAGPEPCRPAAF
jgi:hypothetical protein